MNLFNLRYNIWYKNLPVLLVRMLYSWPLPSAGQTYAVSTYVVLVMLADIPTLLYTVNIQATGHAYGIKYDKHKKDQATE